MKKNNRWLLRAGKISGITIYVHWIFPVLIGWLILYNVNDGKNAGEILYTFAFLLTVFLCVLLHEAAHIWMAKKFKCATTRIILLPTGGISNMEETLKSSGQEIKIALAGIVANLLIAAVIYFAIYYGTGLPGFQELGRITSQTFFLNLFIVNILLVFFNLIPALPMDGGRILLALLMIRYTKHTATRLVTSFGSVIAIILAVYGLLYSPLLVFTGLIIFIGSHLEEEDELSIAMTEQSKKDKLVHKSYKKLN